MKKATSTIISFIIFTFIGLVILALLTTAGIPIINKLKQENNYKQMKETITEINEAIEYAALNKHNYIEITINNPEELKIDCDNNTIEGNIQYDKKYSENPITVNDIVTEKKQNNVYFRKKIKNNIDIVIVKIDDNKEEGYFKEKMILPKGQSKLKFKYGNHEKKENITTIYIYQSHEDVKIIN